ncbi:MAG: hypothetical protein IJS31_04070 [Oscillospiraceae bacterium]|nr:hypothetical protein [Oscillospiraceae bacterium]
MDFRDEVLNAQKEYVDPNVIKQRELEKRKKEHQILVDNYANQIVYSVKSALVSRAKKCSRVHRLFLTDLLQ